MSDSGKAARLGVRKIRLPLVSRGAAAKRLRGFPRKIPPQFALSIHHSTPKSIELQKTGTAFCGSGLIYCADFSVACQLSGPCVRLESGVFLSLPDCPAHMSSLNLRLIWCRHTRKNILPIYHGRLIAAQYGRVRQFLPSAAFRRTEYRCFWLRRELWCGCIHQEWLEIS